MRRVALLAGVEHYRDQAIVPMEYAGDDVVALGARLLDVCRFDRVVVLAQRNGHDRPDCHNVVRRVQELGAEVDEDGLFLFYFSGHGIEWKADSAPAGGPPQMYLLTEETLLATPYLNSLSLQVLKNLLGSVSARQRVLLFDACRNYPRRSKSPEDNRMGRAVARDAMALAKESAPPGATTVLYSACGEGKRAYEWKWRSRDAVTGREEEQGHGVFTHFLLEGLDGAAWRHDELEFKRLVDFTSRNVRDWTRKMPAFQEPQEPWYEEFGAGEVIVLATREETPQEPEKERREERPEREDRTPRRQNRSKRKVWALSAFIAVFAAVCLTLLLLNAYHSAPFGGGTTGQPGATPASAQPGPGEVRVFDGGEFAWIPPGTYEMGSKLSPERVLATYGGEAEWKQFHEREHPRHTVTLTRGFWLATKEVTVGEFRAFADEARYRTDAEKDGSGWTYSLDKAEWQDTKGASWRNPGWTLEDLQPVVLVSWNDAAAYCQWLSRKTGKTYRLPTEAQWEYACRAGTDTEFWWGDRAEHGRGCPNGADETKLPNGKQWTHRFSFSDGYWGVSPAGSFRANPWNLHDMHGNVWEWCADWYGAYASGSVTDPAGPASGKSRVVRGGSWYNGPGRCRSANRYYASPSYRLTACGFRLLRTP